MPIVEAVGTSSGTGGRDPFLARRLNQARTQAVLDALAEGVSLNDSAEILRRKDLAAKAVLKESKQE